MREIQGKSILVRVSARFELARVRVIGSRLYIRHIHRAFIIIFETRHTGIITASLNVFVELLPSSPFRLSPCFFIGVHRFHSTSCFYFHLLNFLGYARGKYLILQPRYYRFPLIRHLIRSDTFSRSVFSVLFPFVCSIFLVVFFALVVFVFNAFLVITFLQPLPGFQSYKGV